jgi:hypothetical protein
MNRFLLIFLISLTGCATGPRQITTDEVARIKRFSVISVVADTFTRQYVGLTVFGNEKEEKSIGDLGTDDAYQGQLGAAAQQALGSTYVRTVFQRSDFTRVNTSDGAAWESIQASVRSHCVANELDALFVIAKARVIDVLGGTNQFLYGLGSYARAGTSVAHLVANLAIVDCQSGKVITARYLAKGATGRATTPWRPPTAQIGEELSRTKFAEWTPDNAARLRPIVEDIAVDSWQSTLGLLLSFP